MHISIASERLINIFGLSISNTVFTAFIVILIILAFIWYLYRNLRFEKPGRIQVLFELIMNYLSGTVFDLLGESRGKKIMGFLFTFLFFILVSNWFGLLPIVPTLSVNMPGTDNAILNNIDATTGTVVATDSPATSSQLTLGGCISKRDCYLTISGIKEFNDPVHVLRAPTSDLSMTIALAILSVIATNALGFWVLKARYLRKFFNFSSPVNFFVGLLELLSEFIRIISFSFRLFGNIFAGELLLTVITALTYGLATLPFFFLEIFVGFIQAVVFFILTAMFMSLAVEKQHN
jgi:F-type H+-transporting ATPase subunit a